MFNNRRKTLTVFILANLALMAGQASAQQAASTPAAQDKVTELDTVQVTGRRAADRKAVEDKRDADNQVDVVRADDVGRLPDQNVAEATRRLAGVTAVNDQGEGRYLAIRGVSPDLLNVTLNGQSAAAPEPDGRQVKLDDIPASLIGAVKVSKTLTPDMDANAIAGEVDIGTLSAFDRNRTFGSARVAYGYNDLGGSHPYEYDGSLGGVFGPEKQFGLVVALNHSDRQLGTQNVQKSGDWTLFNGKLAPMGIDMRQYHTHRERSGAVANFDWRLSDKSRLFARLMRTEYKDSETRDRYLIKFGKSGVTPTSDTTGSFSGAKAYHMLRVRSENTSTTTGSLGGEFDFDNDSTLRVEATVSRADKRDPNRNEWSFVQSKVGGTYELGNDTYTVTPANATNPASYKPDFWEPESRRAIEDLSQLRADYQMRLDDENVSELKFGVKYVQRKKSNDGNGESWGYGGGSLNLATVSTSSIDSIFGGRYAIGPVVDYDAANAYFGAHGGEFTENEDDSLSTSLAGDYRIKEKILAGYVMTKVLIGDMTIIPGVRVERTEGTYSGKSFLLGESATDPGFNNTVRNSYTDLFPSVNLSYRIDEDWAFRGAVSRAIGRPNYSTLAPFVSVEDAGTDEPVVSMGNPLLNALRSTNLDASVERYFGDRGVLAAAVFYKDISNPIYDTTLTGQDGTFGGLALTNATVESWSNAASATVKGIEFNAQYELSFLPSPFDGFSVSGNITFVDSAAKGLATRTDSVPLLNQSDRVASAQLSYEKYGFSARLAYTYRSPQLLKADQTSRDRDLYIDELKQWDLKFGYAINKNFNVFLEGSNLNDAPYRTYAGYRNRLGVKEIYGWSARAGVQFNF